MPDWKLFRRLAQIEPWFWVVLPLSLVTTGIAPILVPLEVEKIEGKALHVGVVMAAVGAGLLTAPLWSRLAERWHAHRDLVVIGAVAIGAPLVVFHIAHEVHEWAFLAFVMGSGAAGVFTVTNVLVMRTYPPDEQAACFGWLQTLSTAGTVAGLMVAGVVAHLKWSADLGFAVGAALAFGAAVYASFKLPEAREWREPFGSANAAPDAPAETPPVRRPLVPFVLLVALWAIGNVGQGAIGALYPLLMREEFALAPAYSSYALAVATALSVLFFVPAGRITSRFGGLPVLQGGFGVKVACLALILGMSIHPWFDQGARGWFVFLPFGTSGLAWPFLSVSAVMMVSRLAPGTTGPGLFDAASAGAFLIGPIVGGHVADTFGYRYVWVLALVGLAIGLLLSLPLAGPRRWMARKAAET